jgi:signal transduction histidine kinase/phosphoribosyl-ATP pyrophosphohydrolase
MRFYITGILFCIYCTATAQFAFETYTPANGLVDTKVTRIVQDTYGRLLFLTRDGFSIFDGKQFDNYTQINGTTVGIVDDAAIMPDSNMRLFSFSYYGITVGKSNVTIDTVLSRNLPEISSVFNMGNGKYIAVSNTGFYWYVNNQYKKIIPKDTSMANAFFNTDYSTVLGKWLLWNNANKNNTYTTYLYNTETNSITDRLIENAANVLQTANQQDIFITEQSGIYHLNNTALQNGKLVKEIPAFAKWLPKKSILRTVYFDRENNVWLFYTQGLLKLNILTGEKQSYNWQDGFLPGVTSMYQDKELNYWFIANGKGVQKLIQTRLTAVKQFNNKNFENTFYCLPTDNDEVYFKTNRNQWLVTNSEAYQLAADNNKPGGLSFYWNNSNWYYDDKTKTISTNNKQKKLQLPAGISSSNNILYSARINFDSKKNAMLAGNYFTLLSKAIGATSVELPYFTDNMVADETNTYYAFCRSNQIATYQLEDGQLVEKTKFIHNPLSPRCVMHWNKDTFWVGTRNYGIQVVKVNANKLTVLGTVTRAKGMSNDFVSTLIRIDDYTVAAGTASGLDIITINKSDTVIERVGARANNYEAIGQLAKTGDILYAVTENANLYACKLTGSEKSNYRPNAWLKEIAVNGLQVNDSVNSFSYNKNNFRFAVAAPSFIDNNNISFHFILNGAGRNWQQNSNNNIFEINNLEPGDYTLEAVVQYPGKMYDDKKLTYYFSINNPYWKNWWFVLSVLLVAVSLIGYIVRNYYQRKLAKQKASLEKQKAIEQERTRISTDMHDDFGANLSRIKFLSEKIKFQKQQDENLHTDLNKISSYSDEMAEKMNEIVWALNQRYDSLGDLVAFSRSYASEYLSTHNIHLNFTGSDLPNIKIQGEIRRNIFLIIKESLHNIVKHAGADKANIMFELKDDLLVTITDNGKGLDTNNIRPFANGLENMKKRIASVNGTISFQNNNGTIISITVPL